MKSFSLILVMVSIGSSFLGASAHAKTQPVFFASCDQAESLFEVTEYIGTSGSGPGARDWGTLPGGRLISYPANCLVFRSLQ